MPTWLIVGASRGLGLEFVRQLLERGDLVIATVRDPPKAAELWQMAGNSAGACQLLLCDVTQESEIERFVRELSSLRLLQRIDYAVINAGILEYPSRATEASFEVFERHMRTNCIGPIITAQKLLNSQIKVGTIVFMSSDSGSTQNFLAHEDGFAAYSASKAALNQSLRHMATELERKQSTTCILAMHPGEVSTDMGNIQTEWDVEGIISPKQSVSMMLKVLASRTLADTGTFWTYEGKVRHVDVHCISARLTFCSNTHGEVVEASRRITPLLVNMRACIIAALSRGLGLLLANRAQFCLGGNVHR